MQILSNAVQKSTKCADPLVAKGIISKKVYGSQSILLTLVQGLFHTIFPTSKSSIKQGVDLVQRENISKAISKKNLPNCGQVCNE